MTGRTHVAVWVGVAIAALAAPELALAHNLKSGFESRLPLAVYLTGAGTTVALSFAFVLLRDLRAAPPAVMTPDRLPPAGLRLGLRAVGLIGWVWIVAQGVLGGTSDADVGSLFLWVYGWVGIPIICAFVFPIWHWLDPFVTLYDIGAAIGRRVGGGGWSAAELPAALSGWPAVAGFLFYVWVELVLDQGTGRMLFIILLGYSAFTLAMMAQYGRDTWRTQGETFGYWFGLVGRLAPFALADGTGRLRRRSFGSGLLEGGWTVPAIVVVALGVGSIIYDGVSQTEPFYAVFGLPGTGPETLILAGFLGIIVVAALAVTRIVGVGPTGAGLLPISVGYLVAHYLTYLLIDGQRIVVAISDPLQRGQDLFGTAFFEPSGAWLPANVVWFSQLAAVVGGHMIGAWAGHVSAAAGLREPAGSASAGSASIGSASAGSASIGSASAAGSIDSRALRLRQVPLAFVMVALTTLTLWSLGQAIFRPPADGAAAALPPAITRAA